MKAYVSVVQSIGRELRVSDDKSTKILYDVVDNLGETSYGLKHAKKRARIYRKEGYIPKYSKINVE